MPFWTPDNLQRITQGHWLVQPTDGRAALSGLSTDTRSIKAGQVFLALAGDQFDGHDFVGRAAERGTAMVIVQKDVALDAPGVGVLRVRDTLLALQTLAYHYRDALARHGCRVIAVGGSNGKTTTRHLIHAALTGHDARRGTQSPRSFNNHIGVPLTLLAAGCGQDFVVVEVGTNHPGEVATLAGLVRPDAAVLTSVGHEHMEFFATLDAVAQEEAALLAHIVPSEHSLALVSTQALPHVRPYLHLPPEVPVRTFGQMLPGDVSIQGEITVTPTGQRFDVVQGPGSGVWGSGEEPSASNLHTSGLEPQASSLCLSLPLLGEHNAHNALAAVAVARWMGVPDDAIAAGLSGVAPVPGRLELRRVELPNGPTTTIIHDAYNANPDSVRLALRALRGMTLEATGARRVVVLGDMLELGAESPRLHRMVGQWVAHDDGEAGDGRPADDGGRVDCAVFIGRLAMFMAEGLSRHMPPESIHIFAEWSDDLPARVASLLQPGDTVLLKASRGMKLERLIPAIEQHLRGHPAPPTPAPTPTLSVAPGDAKRAVPPN